MMRYPSQIPICHIIPKKISSLTVHNQTRNNASSDQLTVKTAFRFHDALGCPSFLVGGSFVILGIFDELCMVFSGECSQVLL